jgi:cytochrome c2
MDMRPNRTTGAITLAVVLAVGYPAAMVLAFLLAGGHPAKSSASADAVHGAMIYHECMFCHSLDKNAQDRVDVIALLKETAASAQPDAAAGAK